LISEEGCSVASGLTQRPNHIHSDRGFCREVSWPGASPDRACSCSAWPSTSGSRRCLINYEVQRDRGASPAASACLTSSAFGAPAVRWRRGDTSQRTTPDLVRCDQDLFCHDNLLVGREAGRVSLVVRTPRGCASLSKHSRRSWTGEPAANRPAATQSSPGRTHACASRGESARAALRARVEHRWRDRQCPVIRASVT
jgi:hypothetical protein